MQTEQTKQIRAKNATGNAIIHVGAWSDLDRSGMARPCNCTDSIMIIMFYNISKFTKVCFYLQLSLSCTYSVFLFRIPFLPQFPFFVSSSIFCSNFHFLVDFAIYQKMEDRLPFFVSNKILVDWMCWAQKHPHTYTRRVLTISRELAASGRGSPREASPRQPTQSAIDFKRNSDVRPQPVRTHTPGPPREA